jgi:hypothetical protein
MLFPRNALASGPQACFFAEKNGTKVTLARAGFSLLIPDQIWYRKLRKITQPIEQKPA